MERQVSDCRVCHCWLWLNHDSLFWPPAWGSKAWDNARSDQSMLEQICCKHFLCSLSICCHNVDSFAIRAVLVLRVKTSCVCCLWWCLSSMGPQLRVIILYFVVEKSDVKGLWCDSIAGHKTIQVQVFSIQSLLYIRSHLPGTIDNNTFSLFSLENHPVGEICPFLSPGWLK